MREGKCLICGNELPGEFPIQPDVCDECYEASKNTRYTEEEDS